MYFSVTKLYEIYFILDEKEQEDVAENQSGGDPVHLEDGRDHDPVEPELGRPLPEPPEPPQVGVAPRLLLELLLDLGVPGRELILVAT